MNSRTAGHDTATEEGSAGERERIRAILQGISAPFAPRTARVRLVGRTTERAERTRGGWSRPGLHCCEKDPDLGLFNQWLPHGVRHSASIGLLDFEFTF